MRIRGVIHVNDVRLVADIDAPDDVRDVYVTNVSPDYIIIPRDRWLLAHLSLPEDVLAAFTAVGIRFLGEVVDAQWTVTLPASLAVHFPVVVGAVSDLRGRAITFDVGQEGPSNRDPIPIPTEAVAKDRAVLPLLQSLGNPLDLGLAEAGFPDKLAGVLRTQRAVTSVRLLIAAGKRRVTMTQGVNNTDIEVIERRLEQLGLGWDTPV